MIELSDIFETAIDCVIVDFAEAHPTYLTNMESIRFFVYYEKRYYPVTSITYRDNKATVHVNRNVWCLDPSSAPSGYTGSEWQNRSVKGKILDWECPELYRYSYPRQWDWKYYCGENKQFLPFRQQGILVLDMYREMRHDY